MEAELKKYLHRILTNQERIADAIADLAEFHNPNDSPAHPQQKQYDCLRRALQQHINAVQAIDEE